MPDIDRGRSSGRSCDMCSVIIMTEFHYVCVFDAYDGAWQSEQAIRGMSSTDKFMIRIKDLTLVLGKLDLGTNFGKMSDR